MPPYTPFSYDLNDFTQRTQFITVTPIEYSLRVYQDDVYKIVFNTTLLNEEVQEAFIELPLQTILNSDQMTNLTSGNATNSNFDFLVKLYALTEVRKANGDYFQNKEHSDFGSFRVHLEFNNEKGKIRASFKK